MNSKDFLFDLVKSLDEKEYRAVLRYGIGGKRRATKKELLLVDLRKQNDYDSQLLRPKYKQYDVLKFQLKHTILMALRLYHQEETVLQKIDVHLGNERILYKKGFYNEAAKELDKAQTLAEEYQMLERLLEILKLKQSRLVERQTKDLYLAVIANSDYIDHILDSFGRQIKAYREYQEMFASYRTEGDGLTPDRSAYPEIETKPFNFYTEMYENATENLQALVQGDLGNAISSTEKAVKLFERYPVIKDEFQPKYKTLLANLGVLLLGEGGFAEVADIIRKLNALDSRDFNEEADTFQNTIHLELLLMLNIRNFEGLNDLIRRVKFGLNHYAIKINAARKLSIWFNLLLLYIVNENYREAFSLVQKIVSHKRFQVRKEIQYATRLLELLIYFELEIWDIPDSIIGAVRRYLYRSDQRTSFQNTVLKYMQILSSTPIEERAEIFRELEHVLHEISNDESNQDSLGLNIVSAWARSKNEKKSVKECLDERSRNGSIDLGNV